MTSRKLIFAADVATGLCTAATIALAIFGAFRAYLFGVLVSVRWTHALFATVALAAVRHALAPRPTGLDAARRAFDSVRARPALADAVLAFTLTRPTVLLAGLLAVSAIGAPPSAAGSIGRDPLATLPDRFDAGWYAGIADDGYEWQYRFDRQQNLAFFPAYPLLMRAAGAAIGASDRTLNRDTRLLRYQWAGLFISLAAFFWAAWYLSRIARDLLGDERATTAVLLLAAYPFAIFYSAAYTESLFLLAAVGAWYHFRRTEWMRAALWGLVAGLSRPNGFMLSVPLGLLALGVSDATPSSVVQAFRPAQRAAGSPEGLHYDRNTAIQLAVAAMPVIGMLMFTVYVFQRTDIWFAWARMHGAWGRSFSGVTLTPVGSAAGLLQLAMAYPFQALNTIGLSFALAMAWPVWRKLGAAWAAFILVNILPPLLSGGVLSMGRLTSTLFPIFLALAAIVSPRTGIAVAAGFGVIQGLAAALFFTWRELF